MWSLLALFCYLRAYKLVLYIAMFVTGLCLGTGTLCFALGASLYQHKTARSVQKPVGAGTKEYPSNVVKVR